MVPWVKIGQNLPGCIMYSILYFRTCRLRALGRAGGHAGQRGQQSGTRVLPSLALTYVPGYIPGSLCKQVAPFAQLHDLRLLHAASSRQEPARFPPALLSFCSVIRHKARFPSHYLVWEVVPQPGPQSHSEGWCRSDRGDEAYLHDGRRAALGFLYLTLRTCHDPRRISRFLGCPPLRGSPTRYTLPPCPGVFGAGSRFQHLSG